MNGVRWGLVGLLSFCLAGCLSLGGPTPPSQFFLLSASQAGQQTEAGPGERVLRLPTVTLPGYLDRPQLVTLRGPGEMHIAPYARWGEPLAEGITRVLGENLRQQLPQLAVDTGTSAAPPGALLLQVAVNRCEGDQTDNRVHFQAHWRLVNEAGKILDRGRADLAEPWAPQDVTGLVEAHDRVLALFTAELAPRIRAALAGNKIPPSRQ